MASFRGEFIARFAVKASESGISLLHDKVPSILADFVWHVDKVCAVMSVDLNSSTLGEPSTTV
jgi:hypothetical protein